MKFQNQHIMPMLEGIKKLENKKANIRFSYGLKKNATLLERELKIVQSAILKQPEGLEDYQKKMEEFAKSVNENKNIEPDFKQEKFDELKEDYDKENETLVELIEEFEKEIAELNESEYAGRVHKIKFADLPDDLSKKELDSIEFLVEFPEDYYEEDEGEKVEE